VLETADAYIRAMRDAAGKLRKSGPEQRAE
jgi:hypothetical protein